jgi:hypothetical protein
MIPFRFKQLRTIQAIAVLLENMHWIKIPWVDFYRYLYIADRNSILKSGFPITGAKYHIDVNKYYIWSCDIEELFYSDEFKEYFDIEFQPFIHIRVKKHPSDSELSDFDEECLKESLGKQKFPEFEIDWEDVLKVHGVLERDIKHLKKEVEYHSYVDDVFKRK